MNIGELIENIKNGILGLNVIDLSIVIILILYTIKGFKNGVFRELISFIGGFAVIVLAYFLKNPVSIYLYEHFPFLKFKGILSGISVLNILVYELIAFLVVVSVLYLIYKLILKISNILEAILKITIILEIPSKILGLVVGFVEGVLVVFLLLFIAIQFDSFSRKYVNDSKLGVLILTETPLFSKSTEPIYKSFDEIYDIAEKYKEAKDKNDANLQALDTLMKYGILDPENAKNLINSKKIEIEGADKIIEKYEKQN